jgi:WW domain-containing oxidoreductase
MHLDLSSLASVAEFAQAFREKNIGLNLLVCNAGVMGLPRTITEDGFEAHFQVNYLAHFLLTIYLLPVLRASGEDVKIINISDESHSSGKMELENIQGNKSYDRTGFYANSKLYQIMSTYALQRRLESSNISVFAVHPGAIDTNITKNVKDTNTGKLLSINKKLGRVTTDLQKGAATTISVAVSPHMKELSGYYFSAGIPASSSPRSRDVKKQEALWNYSLQCLKDRVSTDLLVGLSVDDMSEDNKALVEETLGKVKDTKKK